LAFIVQKLVFSDIGAGCARWRLRRVRWEEKMRDARDTKGWLGDDGRNGPTAQPDSDRLPASPPSSKHSGAEYSWLKEHEEVVVVAQVVRYDRVRMRVEGTPWSGIVLALSK
jgi:hypothetical protein